MSGTVASVVMWEVVWRGGLRIRAAPDTQAQEIGILPYGSRLMELTRQGDWIRHSQGWSLQSMAEAQFLARVAPVPMPMPQGSPRLGPSTLSSRIAAAPWSCGACTYQNDGSHTMCALCGTNQSSIWSCPCSYNNLMNAPHCSSCFQANPNVIVKYQVTWQSGLNIRSAPSAESGMGNVVGSVPHGIILNQLARQNDWIRHERGWTMISAGTHVYMRLHSVTPKQSATHNSIVAASQPISTITPAQLASHFTALIQHQGIGPAANQNGPTNVTTAPVADPTFKDALQQMVHAAHVTLYESMIKILRVDRASEKHLVMLEQIRTDTGITDDEHKEILARVNIPSLEDIAVRVNSVREGEECVVCLDATPTHFLEPCHHLCLCAACVAQFNATTCPRCRETVTGMQRIYR